MESSLSCRHSFGLSRNLSSPTNQNNDCLLGRLLGDRTRTKNKLQDAESVQYVSLHGMSVFFHDCKGRESYAAVIWGVMHCLSSTVKAFWNDSIIAVRFFHDCKGRESNAAVIWVVTHCLSSTVKAFWNDTIIMAAYMYMHTQRRQVFSQKGVQASCECPFLKEFEELHLIF